MRTVLFCYKKLNLFVQTGASLLDHSFFNELLMEKDWTRELLASETKNSFVKHFEHLNNKNNVCKVTNILPICQPKEWKGFSTS